MKKSHPFILALLMVIAIASISEAQQKKVSWKKVKVLVYTKNGKGYVHDNIPDAVKAIQKLGGEHGFQVDVSDDPAVMTEANLGQYTFLLFPARTTTFLIQIPNGWRSGDTSRPVEDSSVYTQSSAPNETGDGSR